MAKDTKDVRMVSDMVALAAGLCERLYVHIRQSGSKMSQGKLWMKASILLDKVGQLALLPTRPRTAGSLGDSLMWLALDRVCNGWCTRLPVDSVGGHGTYDYKTYLNVITIIITI